MPDKEKPRPSAWETEQKPAHSWQEGEYPKGEWVDVCDLIQKEGKYGDEFYLTGRPDGCFNIRYVVKPFRKGELKFRRIPKHLHGKMFKLGYYQNITDCADSHHRSNIRNPPTSRGG